EREFGVRLFERVRGGVVVTDAGAALLPHAESALAAVHDGNQAVHALRSGHAGAVSLALVGTLANANLTQILEQFRRSYPRVRLEIRTATSSEVGALVQRGEVVLGLRYQVDRNERLVVHTVMQERLVVAAPAGHRLADGRVHRPRELVDERWVAF